jgi:large subunit ribosomal protein L37Ae
MHTKKVGTTGRFGSRYGVGIRRRVLKVEVIQKRKHPCPQCGKVAVWRVSKGIWRCRKCNTVFTGGAFVPQTQMGANLQKIIKGQLKITEISETKEEEKE